MPFHPETQQFFASRAEAQRVLKIAAPELVEPVPATPPAHTDKQRLVRRSTPEEVNGQWVYGWDVVDKSQPEIVIDINAERERRLEAGSAFTVTGIADPIPLQGRAFDQTVYLALLARASGYKAAGVTDPILTLRDAADTIHSLTPDQMIQLITQAMTWFENVMAVSWAMKDGTGDFTGGIPTDFTDDSHWP